MRLNKKERATVAQALKELERFIGRKIGTIGYLGGSRDVRILCNEEIQTLHTVRRLQRRLERFDDLSLLNRSKAEKSRAAYEALIVQARSNRRMEIQFGRR